MDQQPSEPPGKKQSDPVADVAAQQRVASLRPSTSRQAASDSKPTPRAPSNKAPKPKKASKSAPSTASAALTPTAASAARSVHVPASGSTPLGKGPPWLPSHMAVTGTRGPAATMEETGDEGDRPAQSNAAFISAKSQAPFSPSPSASAAPRAANTNVKGKGRQLPSRTPSDTSKAPISSSPSSLTSISSQSGSIRSQGSGRNDPKADDTPAVANPPPRVAASPIDDSSIDLYKESLIGAVARYHHAFDPKVDDDPLVYYGAVDGELNDFDSTATLALRDAVIRYQWPHHSLDWDRLSDLIARVALVDVASALVVLTGRGFSLTLGAHYRLRGPQI
ncbi:hypothetical protein B0H16DRAFT_1746393 [Mycena metata]|uniref:Uncharacterized protein n=1 Tax=Mycena metata TaxID=1033252 RepID=A0AAD7GYN0_9AGAR|nr:hypothetical protein B0H16DRAFT_1746393 [Mycena metata]